MIECSGTCLDKNTYSLLPTEDVYYLLNRWTRKRFINFLDLGCGMGVHSIFFAKNHFVVDAVDYSDYIINDLRDYAEKENLNIETKVIEIENIPFEDNTFDCLMAYNSIYHTDKEGFTAMIKEINRILKPGGEAYITLLSKNTWKYKQDYKSLRIDSNTILNTISERDKNAPNFYSDIYDIEEYFKEFEFIKPPVEVTEYDSDNPEYYCTHFKIMIRKK